MTCRINQEKKRPSTLPPPCYHGKPIQFYWLPSNKCLPPKPKLSARYCCPLSKQRSTYSPPSPTICIAGRCPQSPALPSYPESYCRPSEPSTILPPSSCVRFCIRYTGGRSSCYPCYTSNLPKCPANI